MPIFPVVLAVFLLSLPAAAPAQDAQARRTMVAAAHPLAVDAGLQILRAGGSAADAAVAVQMVLGLVEPQSSGIGGGGFLLHWSQAEKRVRSYDGRETAPAAARPDLFLNPAGQPLQFMEAAASGRSVGVPGVLRMLEAAHRRHGRLAWEKLFAPAIRLAEQGFPMSPRLHRLLEAEARLRESPAALALYYGADRQPRPVGETIRNPGYAATLRAIARGGAAAFYSGPIAAAMVDAVASHRRPGSLTMEDLARYRAIERDPVCMGYRGHRVCSMGPPGGGVTVLQILGLLERSAFRDSAPNSAEAVHFFSEAARLAHADRSFLADPAYAPQPVAGLLAADYLDGRAAQIGGRSMGRAKRGTPQGAPAGLARIEAVEASGTSHLSIVDARGDAVAMTSSIESAFGSRILVRGFLLNNELTDFSFLAVSEGRQVANRVEPGKRPRSAMSPTLVFARDGSLRIVLGSVGGPQIINYVARALLAMLDWGMDAQSAVSLPNFGSRNGPTEIEPGSVYETLAPALRARGHEVAFLEMTSGTQVVERMRGGWRGGADPRRDSAARGN